MISASGSVTGSWVRIGLSSIRQNDITGAPIRSEPKLGNACACRPSMNAAEASSSAAVTTPWPPRPWNLTWNIVRVLSCVLMGRDKPPAGPRHWSPAGGAWERSCVRDGGSVDDLVEDLGVASDGEAEEAGQQGQAAEA